MLKSLHQLQEENRRLEEQIKTLTMKKERLQLLSAQLSVPFTPATASSGTQTLLLTYLEIKVNDAHQWATAPAWHCAGLLCVTETAAPPLMCFVVSGIKHGSRRSLKCYYLHGLKKITDAWSDWELGNLKDKTTPKVIVQAIFALRVCYISENVTVQYCWHERFECGLQHYFGGCMTNNHHHPASASFPSSHSTAWCIHVFISKVIQILASAHVIFFSFKIWLSYSLVPDRNDGLLLADVI